MWARESIRYGFRGRERESKSGLVCPSPSFAYSAPRLHVNNNESSVPIRDERETIGNLHSSGGTRHYQGTSEHY